MRRTLPGLSVAQLGALLGVLLLTSASPASAKDKQSADKGNLDADQRAAEMAVDLPNEIASTFESTLPCDLRAPKKKAEKEIEVITPRSKIPLFQSHEIADMEIDADFAKIMAAKDKTGGNSPGTIRYRLENGKQVSLPVEIKIRGNSKQFICKDFKPLMLHFKKEDTKGTVFEHIGDHVKLATHCTGTGSHKITEPNSQIVVRESAAYQILEDNGFLGYKTRLAKMTYKDPDGKRVADGIGFFLEPDGKMAERWGFKHDRDPDAFANIHEPGRQNFYLAKQLAGSNDHGDGHNTVAIAKNGQSNTLAFYDLDMSQMANPGMHLLINDRITFEPASDIEVMKDFIKNHPEGPDAAKAFLERALARKEHTMSIVDNLPIQAKDSIQERLKVWYGAIENVLHGSPAPKAYTLKKDPKIQAGTYGNW